MDAAEQIAHFESDLDNLVERYRKEYDISYASMIGMLHLKAHILCVEANEDDEAGDG